MLYKGFVARYSEINNVATALDADRAQWATEKDRQLPANFGVVSKKILASLNSTKEELAAMIEQREKKAYLAFGIGGLLCICGFICIARCSTTHSAVHASRPARTNVVPPPLPNHTMLRIAKNGQDLGQMTTAQVELLLSNGGLSPSDYYLDATNQWVMLSEWDKMCR
jgi:hypothetical protein